MRNVLIRVETILIVTLLLMVAYLSIRLIESRTNHVIVIQSSSDETEPIDQVGWDTIHRAAI